MANTIKSIDGIEYEILQKKSPLGKMVPFRLGAGGQGVAYKAKEVKKKRECVVKYYHEITPPEFNKNLEKIIAMGNPHEAFIWPQKMLPPRKNGSIGFVMELYDNQVYKKFEDVAIYRNATFKSRRVQLNALIELVSAFEALHAKGYCFQDINEGAIVFDVERGRVKICDCENVAPIGERVPIGYNSKGEKMFMQGFPRYKAPEVEIREMFPDQYTDRYSLAVMIFMILTMCHPLEGKKRFSYNPEGIVDGNVKKDIYGANPIFVFDDNNATNRPDPKEDADAIKIWPAIPSFIKDLFKKAFCQGLPSKGKYDEIKRVERCNRPTEKQWREAFIKWMDMLVGCKKCNVSFVADIDPRTMALNSVCPTCGFNNDHDYPRMKVYRRNVHKRTVLLVPERDVPKGTITDTNDIDPAIEVLKGRRPGIHGIKNVTAANWTCYLGQNSVALKPNDFVRLQTGMKIAFNFDYYGEIII